MRSGAPPLGLQPARPARGVSGAFDAALASGGGSPPAWLVLNALRASEWSSQRDLARALGIEGATLTRHLDRLERAGLVRRGAPARGPPGPPPPIHTHPAPPPPPGGPAPGQG